MVARRSEQFKRQKTRKRSKFPDIFTTVDLQLMIEGKKVMLMDKMGGVSGEHNWRSKRETERPGELRAKTLAQSFFEAQVVHAT